MHNTEFPYRGEYGVKSFLCVDVYHGITHVGVVYGWALSDANCDRLNEVVVCDCIDEDDERKWIAVGTETSGPLELAARALWLKAQTPEVRNDLMHKWDELEISRMPVRVSRHRALQLIEA